MNQNVSIDAALTTTASRREVERRRFPLWALILVAFAALVLGFDASLTPDQRLEVFLQSGMYP
jgi:hypothetical protein